jgi:Astacin (Peptidase family M12A)/Domain of unknown function DUF11
MLRKTLIRVFVALAAFLIPGALPAQPVLAFGHSTRMVTTAGSAPLEGSLGGNAAIANVYWVNHKGARGVAQWTSAAWKAQVPVSPGANKVTVVAVDSRNRAASLQFSIYRDVPPGPQVSTIASGWWHGMPATYAVINGWAIVEGDIILGTAAELAASAPAGPGAHPDGFADGYVSQLWPLVSGVHQIPYTIESGSSNLTTAISYVNSTLTGIIQFVPQTTETNYVTFDLNPNDFSGSCETSVGMIGGQQFVTGSADCTVSTLVHEMGHVIGLLHEHQRPDRDSYVVFNPANSDKPFIAGNFDFFTNGYQPVGLYDYASVMHYLPFNFTKNNLPVLESIPPGIPLGNTVGYTPGDVDTIARLYGLTPGTVTVTTNPPGLQIIVDGVTYNAPQVFTWALNSAHQLSLPPDPQYTSPLDGSTYMFGRWNDGGARSHRVTAGGGSGLLTSPANKPAVTVYEANYVRLQPFASSPFPAGAGTVTVTPPPQSLFGGSFFVDRQPITLSAAPNAGQNFYGWFGPPYPQGANPYPFLIQSPQPSLQGGFTSSPVTVIGENITGPNTWDPPLYAGVDSDSFVDLPQGYAQDYSGSAWAPGTPHTISAPSPDIPVTSNVSYSWNNWSDGGAQTHNITAATSGVANISASYTPVYRSYALVYYPCGGSVQYSQSCPNNDCSFPDGTLLTMTATPEAGSGMVFAGWTGDLSGTTNPQSTTIHDEFLPDANFNLAPTVIAVTSVSPASVVHTPNAINLTVTGQGFVSGHFYAYWNNSFRNSTVVSQTQAVVHLNAGDVANPGAQLLQVSNYGPTNCGALAYTQVLVKASQGTPRLTISKSHTGNFTRGETNATYSVTVANTRSGTGPTIGKVTVYDAIPAGLSLVSMAGTGWTCNANICTRSDALAPGKGYPAITVTVNVSPSAPPSVTNRAAVFGGGSPMAIASDPTVIN